MRYVPYQLLQDHPHTVVDGAAQSGTVLTLSHWPATTSPPELAADTSAQIAFRYLEGRGRWPATQAVSNDHLDQDGLVALFALVNPDLAFGQRAFLEDVAAAGDFATFESRDAARVSFALAALADPDRSILGGSLFRDGHWERCSAIYEELLGILPELVTRPDRYRSLWEEEDASFEAADSAVRAGAVTIEEHPGLDMAVVTVPEEMAPARSTRFMSRSEAGLHPAAVRNRTRMSRLLMLQGAHYRLVFRYESWVRYISRRPQPRADLSALAQQLSAEESWGPPWTFDGAGALEPSLRRRGESSISPDRFASLVGSYLEKAPPAWDPFRDAREGAAVVAAAR